MDVAMDVTVVIDVVMGVTMTMAVAMDVVMDVTMVNWVEWLQNGVDSMEEWRGLYANCIFYARIWGLTVDAPKSRYRPCDSFLCRRNF